MKPTDVKFIKWLFVCVSILTPFFVRGQSIDEDRVVLGNFVERLYNNSPFEGCRIIDDYDGSYLISVVALDASAYKTKSQLNRMSQIKSQRNAGEFLNGTSTFSEFIITTPKRDVEEGSSDITETLESIKATSAGFVQQMQLLTSFDDSEGLKVFVFFKSL